MSAIARDPPRIDFDLIREAFDRSPVGLVIVSTDGVFRYVNRAFCEMLGYACDELEGQSSRAVTHPEDVARDEEHLKLARGGQEMPLTVEKRFVRKSGEELWVRRTSAIMRDDAGQARYIVAAYVDLTEQRQKDSALERHLHFTRALL